MSEVLGYASTQETIDPASEVLVAGNAGRMTLLEALAEQTNYISPNMSNRSTPPMNVDPDDQ